MFSPALSLGFDVYAREFIIVPLLNLILMNLTALENVTLVLLCLS